MREEPLGGKAVLRKTLLAKREALPNRQTLSKAIQKQVLALPAYEASQALLLYLSAGSEVDTWGVFAQALADGKAVYAPRCLDGRGNMAFYRVFSREELVPGRFGLWEPDPVRCPLWQGGGEALCLVPGIAFARDGSRLGYGKGYYDRFLAAHPVESAGLCFGELVLSQVPRDPFDQRVACLVTEAGKEGCV